MKYHVRYLDKCHFAECLGTTVRKVEWHFDKWHFDKCHFAVGRGARVRNVELPAPAVQ